MVFRKYCFAGNQLMFLGWKMIELREIRLKFHFEMGRGSAPFRLFFGLWPNLILNQLYPI
jgi:hypothetical protein